MKNRRIIVTLEVETDLPVRMLRKKDFLSLEVRRGELEGKTVEYPIIHQAQANLVE